MLDILLVNSPIHDYTRYQRFKTSYSTPVGLLYLATILRENGFHVEIIDAEFNQLSPRQIANIINSKSPKFAGFNLFTVNYSIVRKITALINSQIQIIIG